MPRNKNEATARAQEKQYLQSEVMPVARNRPKRIAEARGRSERIAQAVAKQAAQAEVARNRSKRIAEARDRSERIAQAVAKQAAQAEEPPEKRPLASRLRLSVGNCGSTAGGDSQPNIAGAGSMTCRQGAGSNDSQLASRLVQLPL